MNPKQFLTQVALFSLLLVGGFVFLNYSIDVYGLYSNNNEAKVYTNERTAKYLMAHNFIPSNYDACILGPSLSANINPDLITARKTYNASVMGSNATELSFIGSKLINSGQITSLIICLDPYLTRDAGMKTNMMNDKEYWSALGSTGLLKTYLIKTITEYNILPNKYPDTAFAVSGKHNYYYMLGIKDAQNSVKEKLDAPEYFEINEQAVDDLKNFITECRANNIELITYISPVPAKLYEFHHKDYVNFTSTVASLFSNDDIFIDFNKSKYSDLTTDYSNYIDHGHLSESGQQKVASIINHHIFNNTSIVSNQPK